MFVPQYRTFLVKDGSVKSQPHLTTPKDVAKFIREYLIIIAYDEYYSLKEHKLI